MEFEKSNPFDELKAIDQAIDQAGHLDSLRPLFYRLDEIAKEHADAVEVQVAIGDIKQHILNRGSQLKARKEAGRPAPSPLEDDFPTGDRTMVIPIPRMRANEMRAEEQYDAIEPSPPPAPDRPGPDAAPPGPLPAQPRQGMAPRGMGIAIGTITALALIGILAVVVRNAIPAKSAGIAAQIATEPLGASVRVEGDPKCTSPCSLSLPAGAYQIAATLDGYEPGAGHITLAPGQPAALNLILQPQPQTVRIHSDLARGTVILDDQLPAALQNHEYTFENVKPNRHTVKVTGPGAETSFSFDLAPAKLPAVMGTVTARDVLTVLVASFGNRARVVTSSGPWKLAVNGRAQSDAGPAGVDLDSFDPGENELITGEGSDRRSMKERFGPAPALTVFVTTDPNAGTLIVSTGEDGVRVFLNDKEYPLRTRKGELRIQTAGPVAVRVSKDGFVDPPAQVAEVKKGSQSRLEFKMVPSPR